MLKKLIFLFVLTLGIVLFYIFGFLGNDINYALKNRSLQIAAIIIVAFCVGISTIIFQTISNNKILTPSIIGLDSLYMLLQSVLVFSLGSIDSKVYQANFNFLISLFAMVFFSLILYKFLFRSERSIYLIMLLGLICGTLFNTLSSFFEVLIDPDEFMVIQGRMFASFDNISFDILILCVFFVSLSLIYILYHLKFLDPLALGKDLAINLGLNYQKLIKNLLIIVAILTSISTALVGPITFLGLLVANITYELFKTTRHSILFLACFFISIIALVGSVLIISKIFGFNTTVSVIINFIGGIYFIYLVFKEHKI